MDEAERKKLRKKVLNAKGKALWGLILNTPGMADLASHVERETAWEKLPQAEQVTALVVVSNYEAHARVIDEEAAKRDKATPQGEAAPVASEGAATEGEAVPAFQGGRVETAPEAVITETPPTPVIETAPVVDEGSAPTDAPIVAHADQIIPPGERTAET